MSQIKRRKLQHTDLINEIYKLPFTSIDDCEDTFINKVLQSEQVGEGGNGDIYLLDDSIVKVSKKEFLKGEQRTQSEEKCFSGEGCDNDLLLEALIMAQLNKLNLPTFVRFESVCFSKTLGYVLTMKHLKNAVPFTNIQRQLSKQQLLSILFQLIFALYQANSMLHFVHSDLIGMNIMIQMVPDQMLRYPSLNDLTIHNFGVRPVIIDFGYSRIQVNDSSKLIKLTPSSIPDKFEPEELFDGWIDLCKLLANPNFKNKCLEEYKRAIIDNTTLLDLINECNFKTQFYRAVPPFPSVNSTNIHRKLLLSSLFDQIK